MAANPYQKSPTLTKKAPTMAQSQPAGPPTPKPGTIGPYGQMTPGATPTNQPGNQPAGGGTGGRANPDRRLVNTDPTNFFATALQPISQRALDLLDGQKGFTPFAGDRAADFSGAQTRGIQDIAQTARQGNPLLQTGMDYSTGLVQQGGMNPYSAQGVNTMGQVASGQQSLGQGGRYGALANNPLGWQQQEAQNEFAQVARGRSDVGTGTFDSVANNPLGWQQQEAQNEFANVSRGQQDVGTGTFDNISRNPQSVQQSAAQGTYGAGMMGQLGVSGGRFDDLYRGSAGPSNSESNLAAMASGQYLSDGNPYANEALDRAMKLARANIASDASLSGRAGSVYHQGRLADELGSLANEFARQQYESDKGLMLTANQQMDAQAGRRYGQQADAAQRSVNTQTGNVDRVVSSADRMAGLGQQSLANQMAAAGQSANIQAGNRAAQMAGASQLASLGQQGINNRLTAAGQSAGIQSDNRAAQMAGASQLAGLGQQAYANQMSALQNQQGVDQQNIANRLGAATGMTNAGFTAADAALTANSQIPMFDASRYADGRALYGVGALQQDQRQREIDANMARWNETQDREWNRLGAAANIITGGGLPASTISAQNSASARDAAAPSPLMQGLGIAGSVAQVGSNLGLFGGSGGGGLGSLLPSF
jgi:hypothetical protein